VVEGTLARAAEPARRRPSGPLAVEVRGVSRSFGTTVALDGVDLLLRGGEIRALLGPNGAGKTTLLRILTGLVDADAGEVRVAGVDVTRGREAARRSIGFVPAGDRSFYLRISGRENLVFFARLHGLRRSEALAAARRTLEAVGLAPAADRPVSTYSHGMQKRLSLARALLTEPPVLLVDEATHDVDPEGARRVRALVEERAAAGTAVLWTTQRLEEVRGFAHAVTLLSRGRVRFEGTVPALLARHVPARHVVTVRSARPEAVEAAVRPVGSAERLEGGEHLLQLDRGATLGDAVALLREAGCDVIACRAERPELEEAFLALTEAGIA
jgi:ABC-type multidrug transport system ATPase subunit